MATISDSFIAVEGPRKKEVLSLTDVNDDDTVTTTIQNPSFGQFVANVDGAAATASVGVSISGRVVTLASADLDGTVTGVLTVYGF